MDKILFNDYLNIFNKILLDLQYKFAFFEIDSPRRSMNNVELFFVCAHILKLQPDIIFESGVYKGRSTSVLCEVAKHIPKCKVIAAASPLYVDFVSKIEQEYCFLTVYNEFGEQVIQKFNSERIVAIIDGPKAKQPEWKQLFHYSRKLGGLLALFQHDVGKRPDRQLFCRFYKKYMSTKFDIHFMQKDFEDKYKCLDKTYRESPGLGCWLRKNIL